MCIENNTLYRKNTIKIVIDELKAQSIGRVQISHSMKIVIPLYISRCFIVISNIVILNILIHYF